MMLMLMLMIVVKEDDGFRLPNPALEPDCPNQL